MVVVVVSVMSVSVLLFSSSSQMSADLKAMEEDKDRVFAKLTDEIKAKEDLQGSPSGLLQFTTLSFPSLHNTCLHSTCPYFSVYFTRWLYSIPLYFTLPLLHTTIHRFFFFTPLYSFSFYNTPLQFPLDVGVMCHTLLYSNSILLHPGSFFLSSTLLHTTFLQSSRQVPPSQFTPCYVILFHSIL